MIRGEISGIARMVGDEHLIDRDTAKAPVFALSVALSVAWSLCLHGDTRNAAAGGEPGICAARVFCHDTRSQA